MKQKLTKKEKQIISDHLIEFYCDELEKLTGMKVAFTGKMSYGKKSESKKIRKYNHAQILS